MLVFAYDRIREFAAARADLAIANGRRLLSVESWLHVDIEPAMNRMLSQHTAGGAGELVLPADAPLGDAGRAPLGLLALTRCLPPGPQLHSSASTPSR